MSLFVVGYPELRDSDRLWIETCRARFADLQHDPVPPHFTLMFALRGLEPEQLVDHVQSIAADWRSVPFTIRCAIPFKDVLSEYTYLFLVPDEGFSQMVRLHDALYTGMVVDQLRLDVPFIPHITPGYTRDVAYCKQAADAINTEQHEINGIIKALELLQVDETGAVQAVGRINLGKPGTSL